MNKSIIKIGGAIAIVAGAAALYASGVAENTVVALVAGVFVLGGVIAALLKE